MRIVSLEPFLTDIVVSLGLAADLIGISPRCTAPKDNPACKVLSASGDVLMSLRELNPDVVLLRGKEAPPKLEERLSSILAHQVLVRAFEPARLSEVFETFEKVSVLLAVPAKGNSTVNRVRAQLMDWCDNFYDRMRSKKVTFLASVTPLRIAGGYIPDLIGMASCVSHHANPGEADLEMSWEDVSKFRPDVIIVAPQDFSLEESMRTFKLLERQPEWESLPATKRGEVFFCDGLPHFYRPSPNLLIESMAMLISCAAGLDSGYITPRDSFHRLRWLELMRHKL